MTHPEPNAAAPLAPAAAALIVTSVQGIEDSAASLAEQLRLPVEIAASRAAALRLLDRRVYAIVIVDQDFSESDPDGADLIWKHAGHAIPLQVSLALSGSSRLLREVRAALARRQREQALAAAAASATVDARIRDAVTGFLLESRLALQESGIPPALRGRLTRLAEIAGQLQELLAQPRSRDATPGGLNTPAN